MLRSSLVIICVIPVLSGFFLTGCNNDEMNSLRSKVESLEGDVRLERNRNEDLEKRFDTSQRELAKMKLQLQDSQSDRDKLNEALKKLDKEFSDYKLKYKAAISKKIPGLQLPEFVVKKKTYQGLVVKRVDDESVTCESANGVMRFKKDELPADMVALLAMDQKTDVQTGILALFHSVQDHIDGKTSTEIINSGMHGEFHQYADVLQSVAFLKGKNDEGTFAGTGFIGVQNGITYFFTNAHMVGGRDLKAQLVLGPDHVTPVPLPKMMEVSDEEEADDLVRFELPDCKLPALQIADKNSKLSPGEFIMALGNSEGAGVIPCIKGRTGGIGTYWVEIDAPVTHGNSGGPVVLDGGKTVIGVVTRYEHALADHTTLPGSSSTGIRRLCVRPEKIEKWRRVPQQRIAQELHSVQQIEEDNKILQSLTEFRLTVDYGSAFEVYYVKPKFYEFKESQLAELIASYLRDLESGLKEDKRYWDQQSQYWNNNNLKISTDARKNGMSLERKATQQKVKMHVGNFLAAVRRVYGADVTGVDPVGYCAFCRKRFEEEAKDREKVIELVNKHFSVELRQFVFDAS